MAAQNQDAVILDDDAVVTVDVVTKVRRKEVLLKTAALQRAMLKTESSAIC